MSYKNFSIPQLKILITQLKDENDWLRSLVGENFNKGKEERLLEDLYKTFEGDYQNLLVEAHQKGFDEGFNNGLIFATTGKVVEKKKDVPAKKSQEVKPPILLIGGASDVEKVGGKKKFTKERVFGQLIKDKEIVWLSNVLGVYANQDRTAWVKARKAFLLEYRVDGENPEHLDLVQSVNSTFDLLVKQNKI